MQLFLVSEQFMSVLCKLWMTKVWFSTLYIKIWRIMNSFFFAVDVCGTARLGVHAVPCCGDWWQLTLTTYLWLYLLTICLFDEYNEEAILKNVANGVSYLQHCEFVFLCTQILVFLKSLKCLIFLHCVLLTYFISWNAFSS